MKSELLEKLISKLVDSEEIGEANSDMFSKNIGKKVIVRTRNEGLNFGTLTHAERDGCVLQNAQRLYRPISKNNDMAWYEGVAQSGLDERSKISSPVKEKVIVEDYSITLCTAEAILSIEAFTCNKTDF